MPTLVRLTRWLLLPLLLTGCAKKAADTPAPAPTMQLREAGGELGRILTDGAGHTLYYDARDVRGTGTVCATGCPTAWPALDGGTGALRLGTGLDTADFRFQTTGTTRLLTYRGWPLYRRANEATNVATADGEDGHYAVQPGATVTVANAPFLDRSTNPGTLLPAAPYLTDGRGRTLYTFALDARAPTTQATNCLGQCLIEWPTYATNAPTVVPTAVRATDFSALLRPEGQQLIYKGQPLYYWYGEAGTRGFVGCHHVDEFGGIWLVARP